MLTDILSPGHLEKLVRHDRVYDQVARNELRLRAEIRQREATLCETEPRLRKNVEGVGIRNEERATLPKVTTSDRACREYPALSRVCFRSDELRSQSWYLPLVSYLKVAAFE